MSIAGYSLIWPVLIAAVFSVLLIILCVNTKLKVFGAACFFISACLSIIYITADYFSGRGIDDSVAFHLFYAINGQVLLQFRWLVIALVLVMLLVCLISFRVVCYKANLVEKWVAQKYQGPLLTFANVFLFISSLFSLAAHPAVKDISNLVEEYVVAADYTESFPPPLKITPVKALAPKSFVYIYAESLEEIFFDAQLYPGLLNNLPPLLASGVRFQHIYQAPYTGWTIAGMVASQCGLPLSTFGKRDTGAKSHMSFLPQAVCMGDILAAENYNLTYMGGADLDFGGKGNFYRSHGFQRVVGKNELQDLYDNSLAESAWGIYDDRLLNIAFSEFESLAKKQANFGLFLLTLDTHPPKGHVNPTCIDEKYVAAKSAMLSAIYCTDRLLADFITRLINSPLFNDVVLILASDHLLMGSDAGLKEDPRRGNFMAVLNAGEGIHPVNRQATMFDVAPTLLYVLGFEIEALGLGRNLYSDEPTLYEHYGADEFYKNLRLWKYSLWDYWDNNSQ